MPEPTAEFHDCSYEDSVIQLDDHLYTGCDFTRCELVYSGSEFVKLMTNTFTECHFRFAGPAAATLAFLHQLYVGGGEEVVWQIVRHQIIHK